MRRGCDMLQLTPQLRILLAVKAVDFRKGIDGLAQICRKHLHQDPFSGTLFVFRSRKANALKILFYDGQGFWLCHKRLSEGRLRWWPKGAELEKSAKQLAVYELQSLLWNADISKCNQPALWKPLPVF
jgi:transposase